MIGLRRAKGRKRAEKLNSRGFSLVELLIAISILAIAIVPVIHGFISSIRLNTRTRGTLDTTMVAQDMIEGFKSKGLEDLVVAFDAYEKDSTKKPGFIPADLMDDETKIKKEAVGDDGILTVQLKDLVVRTDSAYARYDAVVKVDPTLYRDKPEGASGDYHRPYNAEGLAKVEKIDSTANAECIDEITSKEVEDELDNYEGTGIPLSALTRVITVDIEEKSGVYSVYMTTEYYNGSTSEKPVYASYVISEERAGKLCYRNDVVKLQNVYLYYLPGYELDGDEIVINNPGNLAVNVYLYKQKRKDITETQLLKYEGKYASKLKVKINEKELTDDEPNLDICSNFSVNLYNSEQMVVNANTVFTYYLNGTPKTWDPGSSSLPFDPLKPVHEYPKDRMFDVQVDIYEEDYFTVSDTEWTTDVTKKQLASISSSKLH